MRRRTTKNRQFKCLNSRVPLKEVNTSTYKDNALTLAFIHKYLQSNFDRKYSENTTLNDEEWNMMFAEYNDGVDKRKVQIYANNMPYNEYLRSYWWHIIRHKKLGEAKFRCQINFTHQDNLEVHHNTYEYRGAEMDYMECLFVVCSGCHQMISDAEKLAKMNDAPVNTDIIKLNLSFLDEGNKIAWDNLILANSKIGY